MASEEEQRSQVCGHPSEASSSAPGNRHDLIAKLPRSLPDAVGIDLEDGTPPADKVLEAYRIGLAEGHADVDGIMFDGPRVRRAESVLAPADSRD